jgi:alpha-L-fucosidase
MRSLFLFCCLVSANFTFGQQNHYTPPTDSLVISKLSTWQNWKFGLLMHWGTYSQWGVVESWSICPEDEGWTQRDSIHGKTYEAYKKNYEALQHSFNPVQFDPARWAAAAKHAGMKYVIFTTKHHDGFCMFDTRQTDYKISSPNTPFSSNPHANIAGEIFSAFRKEGLATGAYFSKPDWHNENYWWPYFPPKDRNTNYDPKKYPQRWEAFKQFTYNQIEELMSGYGKMDGYARRTASIPVLNGSVVLSLNRILIWQKLRVWPGVINPDYSLLTVVWEVFMKIIPPPNNRYLIICCLIPGKPV